MVICSQWFFSFKVLFIDLFVCAGGSLWHTGSLVSTRKHLVAARGIYFPDQGSNLGPLPWGYSLSHWNTREVSVIGNFWYHYHNYFDIF